MTLGNAFFDSFILGEYGCHSITDGIEDDDAKFKWLNIFNGLRDGGLE